MRVFEAGALITSRHSVALAVIVACLGPSAWWSVVQELFRPCHSKQTCWRRLAILKAMTAAHRVVNETSRASRSHSRCYLSLSIVWEHSTLFSMQCGQTELIQNPSIQIMARRPRDIFIATMWYLVSRLSNTAIQFLYSEHILIQIVKNPF